jgi:hypothetical protein
LQRKLIEAQVWISLTPVYYIFIYFGALLLLLPFCIKRRLEGALLLSGLGYELAWFFLAASADARYSQWMVIMLFSSVALRVQRSPASRRTD